MFLYDVSFVEKEKLEFVEIHTVNVQLLAGSCHPSDAMSWVREIEAAQTIDDLRTSHPNLEILDAEIAAAEQKAQNYDRFLRGRQIAHKIDEHFRVTGTRFSDFLSIPLRGNDVPGFDTKWDEVL